MTNRHAWVVAVAAMFGGVTHRPATAQDLDAALPPGVIVHALDTDRPCDLSRTVEAIARATGIRVGVEQPARCVPALRAKAPTNGPPMAGRTARALLDELVQRRTEYAWRDVDGVAIVLPRATWADPRHLLRRAVPSTAVVDEHPHLAMHALLDAAGLLRPHEDLRLASAPDQFGEVPFRPVSLDFAGGTVLDALNALAAHLGGHWELAYPGPGPRITVMGPRWEDLIFTVPLVRLPPGDRE